MTKDNHTTRRAVLTGLPAIAAASALAPSATHAEPASRILAAIEELENYQCWESSCVVSAKNYAAYQMRIALGLELPDPQEASLHLYYQKGSYDAYRSTIWFERDLAAGKIIAPPPGVDSLIRAT